MTNGVHSAFELIVHALRETPASLFRLFSVFGDALGLSQERSIDFPRPREWEAAVDRYRALFTAFGIQPEDLLFRLLDPKPQIGPHIQQILADLDDKWDELLTRRTVGIHNALEESGDTFLFPAALEAFQKEVD